jgi:hypothetical protein
MAPSRLRQSCCADTMDWVGSNNDVVQALRALEPHTSKRSVTPDQVMPTAMAYESCRDHVHQLAGVSSLWQILKQLGAMQRHRAGRHCLTGFLAVLFATCVLAFNALPHPRSAAALQQHALRRCTARRRCGAPCMKAASAPPSEYAAQNVDVNLCSLRNACIQCCSCMQL